MERFWLFQDIPLDLWNDWKWQIKNSLKNIKDIERFFPNIQENEKQKFMEYIKIFNFKITPYFLSLVELDDLGNPKKDDPIWRQVCYLNSEEIGGKFCYNGSSINWELPEELPTPILHHKYPEKAVIRLTNECFSYCNYCYLTSRVLDRRFHKEIREDIWDETINYLKNNPQITEIIISGGDPLILNNKNLERILFDLKRIKSIKNIKINTRVFSFNPFRINKSLIEIFKAYKITSLEIHIVHPREITDEFDMALELFEKVGYRPIIFWKAPLIKGINDDEKVLEELILKLYQRRILPYYIYHYAPYTLGREKYGLPIKRGCELLLSLKGKVPESSIPKYVLIHKEGFQEVPLDLKGSPDFIYDLDENQYPIVKFKNWKGNWVIYPDIKEGG